MAMSREEFLRRKRDSERRRRADPIIREQIKAKAREAWKSGIRKEQQLVYWVEIREKHFFRYRAKLFNSRFAKISGVRLGALDLARLWKSQRGRCALSGRKLGRNAHLDHALAIARGGGHTLDNLRWVDPVVNLVKRDLTDVEFIALCGDVLEWIGKRWPSSGDDSLVFADAPVA